MTDNQRTAKLEQLARLVAEHLKYAQDSSEGTVVGDMLFLLKELGFKYVGVEL